MTTSPAAKPLSCVDLSGIDLYADNPEVTSSRYRLALEETIRTSPRKVGLQWRDHHRGSGGLASDWLCHPPLWGAAINPRGFSWDTQDYRLDPGSRPRVMRPWNCLLDVETSGARYVRWSTDKWSLILGVSPKGITVVGWGPQSYEVSWITMEGVWEWSSDLVSWHPCTIEV